MVAPIGKFSFLMMCRGYFALGSDAYDRCHERSLECKDYAARHGRNDVNTTLVHGGWICVAPWCGSGVDGSASVNAVHFCNDLVATTDKENGALLDMVGQCV